MPPRQETFYVDLVGNNFRDDEGKAAFELLETGHKVELEPDFENPYDENAFRVYAVDQSTGERLLEVWMGFIDKFSAASFAQYWRAGWRYTASVYDRRRGGQGLFKNGSPKPDKPIIVLQWDGADKLPAMLDPLPDEDIPY